MSALDQAVIKAYAKTGIAPSAALADGNAHSVRAATTVRAQTIDQIYHNGALYRLESHGASASSLSEIRAPHLAKLPPTSPRRAVRRSMLRMLAAQPAATAVQPPVEPSRVARKVIIRHISHESAPRPLGLRPSTGDRSFPAAELPPETISPEPAPSIPQNPAPGPLPATPLNVAVQPEPIEIRGDWEHESAVAPMVLISDSPAGGDLSVVVNVQIESWEVQFAETVGRANYQAGTLEPGTSFTAKSLDDTDEPRFQLRLDAAHAAGAERPHARFRPVTETGLQADDAASGGSSSNDSDNNSPSRTDIATGEELTFAETSVDALASDLIPSAAQESSAESAAAPIARPALPVWEVDRFHWPRTVEKLFAHEQGYLTGAGEKLQAAMQDGLKVLAITGSRRGEGRSTLALCLARAAAQFGIQVAVMDADFARPQLASKIGIDVAHGWQEAAIGKIPLSEAAVKSLADHVTLLPLESSAPTRALSLADPRVTATIRAAAATFDLLILDLGPLAASESIAFPPGEACALDAAIVVRDLRFATAAESEAIGHSLQDAGVEAVGIAENFVIDDESSALSH